MEDVSLRPRRRYRSSDEALLLKLALEESKRRGGFREIPPVFWETIKERHFPGREPDALRRKAWGLINNYKQQKEWYFRNGEAYGPDKRDRRDYTPEDCATMLREYDVGTRIAEIAKHICRDNVDAVKDKLNDLLAERRKNNNSIPSLVPTCQP